MKYFEKIFEYVNSIDIIDTHEHLPASETVRVKETDVLQEYLSQYFKSDIISAGLDMSSYLKVVNRKQSLQERWKIVEPYWKNVRYTGYGQVLYLSIKELYDIDDINENTIVELNDAFLESLKPGHYNKVLKEKSKIKISILDENTQYPKDAHLNCDPKYFKSVYCMDDLVYVDSLNILENIESSVGFKICSFSDWLDACEEVINKALKKGIVGLKCHLAYRRSLKFDRYTKSEAEKAFNNIFKIKHYPQWIPKYLLLDKSFQDYMMHYILNIANKKNMTFQVHTGMHEGNGNIISNSNPELLSNLFLEYPNVNFDIFHSGYPYQNIVSVLAKTFPNVYIDMCWTHIISPVASINALLEWIETVPLNKISAFGGDYQFIDGVFGAQYLARINVSKALAQKVQQGLFDLEKAKDIAEMYFYRNPKKLFNLNLESN